jgi:hypothetical protein
MDCPINQYANLNFIVAVHNPTTIPWSYIKLKVQYGYYRVQVYNGTNFNDLPNSADVICATRFIKTGNLISDCDLHIQYTVPPNSVAVIQLIFDSTNDLTV